MVDRTFDVITEKGETIKEVPERLVMDVVNMIMTKDNTRTVVLMDHVYNENGNSLN